MGGCTLSCRSCYHSMLLCSPKNGRRHAVHRSQRLGCMTQLLSSPYCLPSTPQCSYYVDFKGDSPYVVQEGEDPGLKGKLQLLKVTCSACVCLPGSLVCEGKLAGLAGGAPTHAGSCRQ